jgi:excisionase family DNA binding protein
VGPVVHIQVTPIVTTNHREAPMTPLLDRSEVAELLHTSVRTIDRLRKAGELRDVVVRRCVRFDPADVQAFLHAKRRGRPVVNGLRTDVACGSTPPACPSPILARIE